MHATPFPGGSCECSKVDFLDGVLEGHQQLSCRVSACLYNRVKPWGGKIAAHLFCLHVQEGGSAVANKVGRHKGEARFYLLLYGEPVLGVGDRLLNGANLYCTIIKPHFLFSTNTCLVPCPVFAPVLNCSKTGPKTFQMGKKDAHSSVFAKTPAIRVKRGNNFVTIIAVFFSKNIQLMICSGNSGVFSGYHHARECVSKVKFASAGLVWYVYLHYIIKHTGGYKNN